MCRVCTSTEARSTVEIVDLIGVADAEIGYISWCEVGGWWVGNNALIPFEFTGLGVMEESGLRQVENPVQLEVARRGFRSFSNRAAE
jgi:hypothetical protein